MNQSTETVQVSDNVGETRPCTRCKGEGTTFRQGFSGVDSVTGRAYSYPDKTEVCSGCHGLKTFATFDADAIKAAIVSKQGPTKGKLKSSYTVKKGKGNRWNDAQEARNYFVWRMVRFHSGADVTMPVMAGLVVRGDPFVAELDKLADKLALEICGDNMRGARRWAQALYGV